MAKWPRYAQQLSSRSAGHWLSALALVAVGTLGGIELDRHDFAIEARYRVYGFLQEHLHGDRHAKRTALVLIEDPEYWKGELGRRIPIKRTYLAKLLRKLEQAQPALIGIDFSLRSPVIDGSLREHPDYASETKGLADAIREVSRRRPIILPATFQQTARGPVLDSAIYSGTDFRPGDVRLGHIHPSLDMRRVPVAQRMADGSRLYSFAAAMANVLDPAAVKPYEDDSDLPFGTFMSEAKFPVLSADFVLHASAEQLLAKLRWKAVILGAGWNERAFGLPPPIDEHLTPIGYIRGTFAQANWAEALLDSRVYRQVHRTLAISLEVVLSLAVAVIFGLRIGPLPKLGWTAACCLVAMLLGYFLLQNLGVYFDFYLPVLLLMGHAVLAKVHEWRELALHPQAA